MIVYDDMEITEKVKVYDRGILGTARTRRRSSTSVLVGYRTGDMWSPQLDTTEALALGDPALHRNVFRGRRQPAHQAGMQVCRWCVFWRRPPNP